MNLSSRTNPYIGQRIRLARKRLGLSQETLAADLDISVSYLGQLERGKRPLGLPVAEKLCRYFHLTLDYLYTGMEPAPNRPRFLEEADPRKELSQVLRLCDSREIRLCLDVINPLLVNWREALSSAAPENGPSVRQPSVP